jgi:hypothetical protein
MTGETGRVIDHNATDIATADLLGAYCDVAYTSFAPEAAWTTVTTQMNMSDLGGHAMLLQSAGIPWRDWTPVFYTRVIADSGFASSGSSDQRVAVSAAAYYEDIDKKLDALAARAGDPDAPVEIGAVETSRQIINQIRRTELAPPAISWIGGEAVVMLWEFNSIAWAITVTEGEVGYVIRRDRKLSKMRDSIRVQDFKLLEMK